MGEINERDLSSEKNSTTTNQASIGNQNSSLADVLKERLKKPRIRHQISSFNDETHKLYNALLQNDLKILNNYLDRKVYFLLGPPYYNLDVFYKQLSSMISWPREELQTSLITHNFPYLHKYGSNLITTGNNFWREPQKYCRVLFEISQYVVYLHREAKNADAFLNFNWLNPYFLGLLDDIFGKLATYIVIVSNPINDFEKISNWYTPTHNRNIIKNNPLKFWEVFHREIVRDAPFKGELKPIKSTDDWWSIIRTLGSDFENRERSLQTIDFDDFLNKNNMEKNTVQSVKKLWSAHGYSLI